ncbi:histidine kinase [Solirubrobacter phytolaccae]|uniref:Histidine kinase n=1 Tax=Solirubrobacter phytolaccae TaxID=1404360 RepID=A0A9X3SFZ5_9ACTN|nr:histidine kinase [Solirubrobacter phytolaccae]MDA0181937.1 histidine kinase [Solirubrobacter phytolaccae]
MDRTDVSLEWMRRVTQWTLASVAGLVVLIPAGDLFSRDDLSPLAIGLALVGLAFVGYVQTRLLLAGMAGLDEAPRSRPVIGAAAVVALALWGLLVPDEEPHWMWVLPFAGVLSGAAFGAGPRSRWVIVGGGIAVAVAVGWLATGDFARVGGAAWLLASFVLLCLAQVWIWDVTLRLDEARVAAGEVAVLRERLRFAGDLHDIQGHQLQAIALKAQLASRLIGHDDEAARGHADDAHALALQALSETRELVQGYRRVGLATELANAVGILKAAGVDAEVEGAPESVPVALQPLFGSLVREGATNLLRHTKAARCEIAVERDGDDVVVRVIDDGVARVVVPSGDGTGVAGLQERFAAVGGRVDAEPLAPRGFELVGRAPHKATT